MAKKTMVTAIIK